CGGASGGRYRVLRASSLAFRGAEAHSLGDTAAVLPFRDIVPALLTSALRRPIHIDLSHRRARLLPGAIGALALGRAAAQTLGVEFLAAAFAFNQEAMPAHAHRIADAVAIPKRIALAGVVWIEARETGVVSFTATCRAEPATAITLRTF